jgi:hypothetical protein
VKQNITLMAQAWVMWQDLLSIEKIQVNIKQRLLSSDCWSNADPVQRQQRERTAIEMQDNQLSRRAYEALIRSSHLQRIYGSILESLADKMCDQIQRFLQAPVFAELSLNGTAGAIAGVHFVNYKATNKHYRAALANPDAIRVLE